MENYGVAIGEKTVLSSVTLDILEKGITILLGPTGTGKSTLVRTLAGFNDGNPKIRTWGKVLYAGAPWINLTSRQW